jgi:hypothetical protein
MERNDLLKGGNQNQKKSGKLYIVVERKQS